MKIRMYTSLFSMIVTSLFVVGCYVIVRTFLGYNTTSEDILACSIGSAAYHLCKCVVWRTRE